MQRIKVSGVDLSIRCHLPILAFPYAKILVSTSPATSVSRDTPVQTGNGPIRKAVVDADDLASGGSGIAWDHQPKLLQPPRRQSGVRQRLQWYFVREGRWSYWNGAKWVDGAIQSDED
jgi:hypothetical protein